MNRFEYCPPYKKLFNLKPKQRNGLILNIDEIFQRQTNKTLRFLYACFNRNNQYLASSDNYGNIYIIDFNNYKYWKLEQIFESCVNIKFSRFTDTHLFILMRHGKINIIDIEILANIGELIGHKNSVESVTFGGNSSCLTASKNEAIVWDLKTSTKSYVLNLAQDCCLKIAIFIPASDYILTCFDDDTIQIWNCEKFDFIQIDPNNWQCRQVKHIDFTKNGHIMVLACHPATLVVYFVKFWKLARFITLPENILSIKYFEFIPDRCDCILAILIGDGSVYFYNIEKNLIIDQLVSTSEFIRFDTTTNYIATVLRCGDIHVYDILKFTVEPMEIRAEIGRPNEWKRRNYNKIQTIKNKIDGMLSVDKLRLILQEFGQFPEKYRTIIWQHLLKLPQNKQNYNTVINCRTIRSFGNLQQLYPLEDKGGLRNLRRLLDNLVTWSRFFAHVDYLPIFVFPFVRIFQNQPIICFEAVCTIIVNWCQFWFEYHPLPPVNILAIIENLLLEHDGVLLAHLKQFQISSKLYAWPLLETAFSQALTTPQWKQFWDHILINHPSFLLCSVVAYNIIQRSSLLSYQQVKLFNYFYRQHIPIDVNRLIKKTYQIFHQTSDKHPKQYLSEFKQLTIGNYPNFHNYPKTIIDYQMNEENQLNNRIKRFQQQEMELVQQRLLNLKQLRETEIEQEEKKRILEMEQAVKTKLLEQHKIVEDYANSLSQIREQIQQENAAISQLTQRKIATGLREQRKKQLELHLDEIDLEQKRRNATFRNVEEDLVQHLTELCQFKMKIRETPRGCVDDNETAYRQIQQRLNCEIGRIKEMTDSTKYLKILSISTGLEVIDLSMEKITNELEKMRELGCKNEGISLNRDLRCQTADLIVQINNLLRLFGEIRSKT